MSISVERLILSRSRPSVASTARKSTVGRAVRAAIRAVSPFNYARVGFDWNSQWECNTLSVVHLASNTNGSGVGTTITVPRGGPGWKAQRRKGKGTFFAGGAPKGPRRWMVSCDSLRVCAGCAMLAILPTHSLIAVCRAWICGRNFHSGGRQEYRNLQNREYG